MNEITTTQVEAVPATVSQAEPVTMMNIIAAVAMDPHANVEKLQALVNLQAQLRAAQAREDFIRAMSAAQAEMLPVSHNAKNSHTNSRYATLEAIDDAIRPIYTKHGFNLSFDTAPHDTGILLLCQVAHSGGHVETRQMQGALDGVGSGGRSNKTAIQAAGSTTTYLRRYLTCLIFNITTTDDTDGNKPARVDQLADELAADREQRRAPPPQAEDHQPSDEPLSPSAVWLIEQIEAANNPHDIDALKRNTAAAAKFKGLTIAEKRAVKIAEEATIEGFRRGAQ